MNLKLKRMIISYSRRLSMSWEPRVRCKDKAKVAPALHVCAKCGTLCYEGSSEKNYTQYLAQFPDRLVLFAPIEIDHIKPVVDVYGWTNWEDFFAGLFCDEDNFWALCPKCHSDKTALENSHRPNYKPRRHKSFAKKKKGKK
jgi:5-methylcytosine-specific restriction endonuclease McrA